MKQLGIISVIAMIILVGGVLVSNNLAGKSTDGSDNPILSRNGIHYHPKVEIYIHGERQDIPANIGLTGGHSPMHTHDPDGTVHLEYGSGIVRGDDTRLGNFFKLWGKEFSNNQIFEYTNGEGGTVSMVVNGESNTEFEDYEMRDGDKIIIRYE